MHRALMAFISDGFGAITEGVGGQMTLCLASQINTVTMNRITLPLEFMYSTSYTLF